MENYFVVSDIDKLESSEIVDELNYHVERAFVAERRIIKLKSENRRLRKALQSYCQYLEARYDNSDSESAYYEEWQNIELLLKESESE
jgi:hypothetical protein